MRAVSASLPTAGAEDREGHLPWAPVLSQSGPAGGELFFFPPKLKDVLL